MGERVRLGGAPQITPPQGCEDRGTLGTLPTTPQLRPTGVAEGQDPKVVGTCPSTPTHHTWMLGLERYELPQGGHVGRLVGGHWWRGWVQDVMVAGDDGGECLVGDGKLLHGTCLNQLWGETKRKTRVRHPCLLQVLQRTLYSQKLALQWATHMTSGHSQPRLSSGVPCCDSPGVGGSRAGSAVH